MAYIDEYLSRPAPVATARPSHPTAAAVRSRARATAGRLWPRARPYLLPVAGFASFTAAAGAWHVWAGLVVAGIACFVLDYNPGGHP